METPIKILDNSKHNAFPSVEISEGGKLMVGYRCSPSHLNPIAKACILYSEDMGKSWPEQIILDDGKDFKTSKFGIRSVNLSLLNNNMVATYHVNN